LSRCTATFLRELTLAFPVAREWRIDAAETFRFIRAAGACIAWRCPPPLATAPWECPAFPALLDDLLLGAADAVNASITAPMVVRSTVLFIIFLLYLSVLFLTATAR